jgi:hypothetical protein
MSILISDIYCTKKKGHYEGRSSLSGGRRICNKYADQKRAGLPENEASVALNRIHLGRHFRPD